jgi:alpha-mannosidase
LYLEYHRGVYTTQANHKKNMRDSEEEVLNAEKFSSLAWLFGAKYPADELTEDWKKVLFNQFHDLAAGSGIGVIYKDAQKDYDWVRMSTNEISAGALGTVDSNIRTEFGAGRFTPVIIYNPLGWERDGEVTVEATIPVWNSDISVMTNSVGLDVGPVVLGPFNDPNGYYSIPFEVVSENKSTSTVELKVHVSNVPPLGYRVIWIAGILKGGPNPERNPVRVASSDSQTTLDNSILSLEVDKASGCITGVRDVKSGGEALAENGCGNQLQFFKDLPKNYDAWNVDPGTFDVPPATIDKADLVEMVGQDAVRVKYHWQSSTFVQTIRLEGDIVDIENDIDWHEKHILLKAAFPLAVKSDFATYEIPYGAIERPTKRNNSWEKAQFEVPAMRWADLSGAGPDGKVHGLSVLNQDKYGYDAVGNVLRLTLLRSPTWPDPDADQGHHHFHYALYPHAGTWKDALTVRHGWEYNYPLQAVVTTAHAGSLPAEHSFASVSPENVVLTAVKKAEDANGLIFRVYEWAGKETTAEFHVPPGATGATVTNLMEQPEGDPLKVEGDVVKAPVHPYEIVTILVNYPNGGPKP